jgi:4-amino-4-deoxy-L-arabinose transferase-like glycosyltransferase
MMKLKKPVLATIVLLTVVTLLNMLIANRIALSADEAHYALYGSHVAWSYYDHPPLVGWLQYIILFFSHSDFALRIWPMLFNIGSAMVLYRLGTTFFPHEKPWFGFYCVALMQGAIIINLLGLGLLPQTPFIFFGLLTLLFLYQAVRYEKLQDFVLLGIFMGLAALSEYTAIFLALAAALYILTTKPTLFFHPKLYVTALIALIFISPIFIWNYLHDWMSFSYQQNHILANAQWSGKLFSLSQLVQLFAYNPALYILGLVAICTNPRFWRIDAIRLLILFFIPTLLFFAYGSGYTFTLPHWTAMAWLAAIPIVVRYIQHDGKQRWVKILVWCSAIYSVLMILLLHTLAWQAWINLPVAQQPLRDVYGWQTAAQVARDELASMPQNTMPTPTLFVTNWSLASRLAWYSQHAVQIVGDEGNKQFTLWYGRPQENSSGIIVVPYAFSADSLVGAHPGQFKNCQHLRQLMIYNDKIVVNSFDFYRCTGYQIK